MKVFLACKLELVSGWEKGMVSLHACESLLGSLANIYLIILIHACVFFWIKHTAEWEEAKDGIC